MVATTRLYRKCSCLIAVDSFPHPFVDLFLHLVLQVERAHEHILVLRIGNDGGGKQVRQRWRCQIFVDASQVFSLNGSLGVGFVNGLSAFPQIQESERARF